MDKRPIGVALAAATTVALLAGAAAATPEIAITSPAPGTVISEDDPCYVGNNPECPALVDPDDSVGDVTNPDAALSQCVAHASPAGTPEQDENQAESCFSTFAEAISFATSGRLLLPDGFTSGQLSEWLDQNSGEGETVIGIEYNYANYNPNGGTLIYTTPVLEGCRFGNKYQDSYVGNNWNDRISSAQGFASCLHDKHFENSKFNSEVSGSSMVCPCGSMGAMNNETSSIKWKE